MLQEAVRRRRRRQHRRPSSPSCGRGGNQGGQRRRESCAAAPQRPGPAVPPLGEQGPGYGTAPAPGERPPAGVGQGGAGARRAAGPAGAVAIPDQRSLHAAAGGPVSVPRESRAGGGNVVTDPGLASGRGCAGCAGDNLRGRAAGRGQPPRRRLAVRPRSNRQAAGGRRGSRTLGAVVSAARVDLVRCAVHPAGAHPAPLAAGASSRGGPACVRVRAPGGCRGPAPRAPAAGLAAVTAAGRSGSVGGVPRRGRAQGGIRLPARPLGGAGGRSAAAPEGTAEPHAGAVRSGAGAGWHDCEL